MTKKINLKFLRDRQIRPGHPWIYRSEIQSTDPNPPDGSLVEVYSHDHKFQGVGYFNSKSEITVRYLTRHHETIDASFFKRSFAKALAFRERMVKDSNAYRLVSSEADELPGLVVDRYGDVSVIQFLTLGMDRLKEPILEALKEILPWRGIYERSDSSSRRLEGLKESVGWIEKNCGDDVVIHERGVQYLLRFGEGHKTGFYLDQRENRYLLAELNAGKEVLDAFCYVGGFGLHLAQKGCRVLGLDIQKEALHQAVLNRKLNNLGEESLELKEANVFDELRLMEKGKRRFDFIILDPPSFVKKKEALQGALAGYKEIILRSLKLLKAQGQLALFSCSYHVDENLLMQCALGAAWDARRNLRVLKFMKQASDHPINPFIPETYYLKGFLFEVS